MREQEGLRRTIREEEEKESELSSRVSELERKLSEAKTLERQRKDTFKSDEDEAKRIKASMTVLQQERGNELSGFPYGIRNVGYPNLLV